MYDLIAKNNNAILELPFPELWGVPYNQVKTLYDSTFLDALIKQY